MFYVPAYPGISSEKLIFSHNFDWNLYFILLFAVATMAVAFFNIILAMRGKARRARAASWTIINKLINNK